jgi:D-amino-acid oxidase
MDITVVGAGVIGLSAALALEEHGHRVRVVAAATGSSTTSSIAGAVWFPYQVGPPDKVAVWAARTRTWLEELAVSAPESGVDVLTGYEITPDATEASPAEPWWAAATPIARAPAPVAGTPAAWRFRAPRAQPSLFLPYLASRLRGSIERRTITDLGGEPGDLVVNCTGLGARELAGDPGVEPLLGQVLIAARGEVDLATTVTDDRDPDDLFYVIPRRDELVLGGCSRPVPPGVEPSVDPELAARIVAHARALGIAIGEVRTIRVGLRPFRREVRLEREGRVIHNYGHGGAGFTLCRGCAEDVAALADGGAAR